MSIVRQRRLSLAILILTGVFIIVAGLVRAFGPVAELDLDQSDVGLAFELFRDKNGHLWISEYGASAIWQVDPDGQEYTIYSDLTGASDAKVDDNGDLWWTNYTDNEIGRYTPGQISADRWALTGEISQTLGLAIDPNGNIWTTDERAPIIHRFRPSIEEMCTFIVPDNGASSYIVADSGRIWLGDWINNRILALDPVENEIEIWHLPENDSANIYGLAADENHDIWWADQYQNYLGRLTPQHSQITTYTLPGQSWFAPTIVSTGVDEIWTTSGSFDQIARLKPAKFNTQPSLVISSTTTVAPTCATVNSKNLRVTVDGPHAFEWTGGFFNQLPTPESEKWLLYQIGANDPTQGIPWGIIATKDYIYIVDQGRQKLTQLKACFQLTLTHTGGGLDPLGSPDPSGTCPAGEYLSGAVVTLTARPAPGSGVLGWSNTDDDTSTELINQVTMPAGEHTVSVDYGGGTFLPLVQRN